MWLNQCKIWLEKAKKVEEPENRQIIESQNKVDFGDLQES